MPSRTLYFDESGFTGHNLLDETQPTFTIATTDILPAEAAEILRDSFPRFQGREFKFKNIWRSGNRPGLVEFGRRLSGLENHAFTWMVNKRFAVLTKIVDFLIEPYIADAGYDFYADGFCWKYANYIHFGLTNFAPPEFYDGLLRTYQTFSRDPTLRRLRVLQNQLRIMANSAPEDVRIFLEQMALGAELFTRYHDLQTFGGSDELHVTSMIAVLAHWRHLYLDDFAVVHDASANFFRQRDLWERITGSNVPEQLHPLGDGTTVQFPLRVIATTAADSRDNSSIQFCDVLAGLAARCFENRAEGDDREFLHQVIDAGLGEIRYNGIAPSTTFPDQIPPRRRRGPDAVDRMTRIIYGPRSS